MGTPHRRALSPRGIVPEAAAVAVHLGFPIHVELPFRNPAAAGNDAQSTKPVAQPSLRNGFPSIDFRPRPVLHRGQKEYKLLALNLGRPAQTV
jgi:hypothetical protein